MQAMAEAQISSNNLGRAAMSTSRCLTGALDGESLQEVFRMTVRSSSIITKPLTFETLALCLSFTYGAEKITGIIINRQGKAVEISFASNECVRHILANPLAVTGQPNISFKPSFDDTMTITFYNVPLHSTGAAERRLIEDAGATVLNSTIVTKRFENVDVRTGERRFLCSGRSKFTYLPTVVKLYSGRSLGCRYRGQAHDLATKVPNRNLATALAASSNWGAADVSFLQQPIEPRSRSGTLESHDEADPSPVITVEQPPINEDPPPDADSLQVIDVAPPSSAESRPDPTSHSRSRSVSMTGGTSDGERSRSPLGTRRSCSHQCYSCTRSFTDVNSYTDHLKLVHPDVFTQKYKYWQVLKKQNLVTYRIEKAACTCTTCHGFFLTGHLPQSKPD